MHRRKPLAALGFVIVLPIVTQRDIALSIVLNGKHFELHTTFIRPPRKGREMGRKKTAHWEACPFCGRERIGYLGAEQLKVDDVLEEVRMVHCEDCGAYGPPALTARTAVKRWNHRLPPMSSWRSLGRKDIK